MQTNAVLKTVSAGMLALVLAACGGQKEAAAPAAASDASAATGAEKKEIVIGTTVGDFGDMVKDQIQPALAKKGYTVKLIEFTDYVRPNLALAEGELDLNVFQHKPYLDDFKKEHKLDITEVALARVTDEFIAYIRAAESASHDGATSSWDLSTASEFLVVAATLLDLKAARLLPQGEVEYPEDLAILEARDLLFARLPHMVHRSARQVRQCAAQGDPRLPLGDLQHAMGVGAQGQGLACSQFPATGRATASRGGVDGLLRFQNVAGGHDRLLGFSKTC